MSKPPTSTTDSTDHAAERLRSMLVAADSLTLRVPGIKAYVAGRHVVTSDGRLRVELPTRSHLTDHLAQQRETVAMVEVTDLAPTPVRDRVRGRGTLTGWLTTGTDPTGGDQEPVVALDLVTAELTVDGRTTAVDPEAFATARPDPLAAAEADLLCHLDHHHPQTVERLCRLIPARHLQGVRQVRPVRLDRHGVVLRLELTGGDRNVRLSFRTPLLHPDHLGHEIEALLREAHGCRSRRVG
ncbi:DUF2470 domain-containing protein [Micromonospora sp. WMMD961]|uniref:DUF2470 domain-containing protein n=1 Tax=Micromonospora sp. WMMD961 TaxID=3016100 RepID=UPI002417C7FC|nr:DUF2470 domain-containing protein [Micromonospora sp. WMMD961]MDG4782047.1 DUF2470 domain-containing protein [Micromonospora sp. WMMD961]